MQPTLRDLAGIGLLTVILVGLVVLLVASNIPS